MIGVLGEFTPDSPPIRHAIKINFWSEENYYQNPCYRWPAIRCDGDHSKYNGSQPAMKPGALLALPPSINIGTLGLETKPAAMLAWTLQNYGGYVADDTAWSAYSIETETGPVGAVEDEFMKVWGFPFTERSKDTPWSRDIDRIVLALHVVDSWDEDTYMRVKQSNGTEGAGGGIPRQPWIGN
eukprot:TRINITY_DN2539_c0_g2_i2.p1 TRINITY_DN2539_c0_g2~~TRINITY_DN2539_c0_g2_i2.p1  ORF type:complete len:183 (-),score=36.15 TRINITY_DN2539_c0_g2_i2:82-630(-)